MAKQKTERTDQVSSVPQIVNHMSALSAKGIGQAQEYLAASRSENTTKAYRSDWNHFESWCRPQGVPSLPADPQTVAIYVAEIARSHRVSTVQRRVAAISVAHQSKGLLSPTQSPLVRDTLKGIRRTVGTSPDRKSPVRVEQLREIVTCLSDSPKDIRDKALLLVGYAGAFRRSELVSLNVEDLAFLPEGIRIHLRRSKTDQEGEGHIKGVGYGINAATCPVRALRAWMDTARISSGPLFRPITKVGMIQDSRLSDKAVSLVIKSVATRCGMDPDTVSGHSLRAGFVTDQYAKGTAEGVIMQQTGHKSRTVLGIYRRETDAFAFNFTAAAGL